MRTNSRGRSRRRDSDERVHVHARCRPLLEREKESASGSPPIFQPVTATKCNVMKSPGEVKPFTFDTVFDEHSTQDDVYEKVAKNIIEGALSGYNGTLFAYGQTGTGKTHTMMGSDVEGDGRGIIPRALDHIFETVEANSDKYIYELNMSYVQLYCELLQDLLEPDFSKTLTIREDTEQGRGVFIQGLSSFSVASKDECLNLLRIGHENRAVAETNMNSQSSRSHAAFMLSIERRPKATFDNLMKEGNNEGKPNTAPKKTFAKLFIVDLAGSERVKTSGTMHGQRFSELKSINLSLSALGNCISALSEKKRHIPFRDSKLTRLLQDSLGGNARTSLVINVNACPADINETFSSLMFGQRAMAVETRAKRNVEIDYKALYATVQSALDEKDDEIHRLQIELSKSKTRVDSLLNEIAKARSAQQSAEMQANALSAVQNSLSTINDNDVEEMKGSNSTTLIENMGENGDGGGGLFLTGLDMGGDDENNYNNNNNNSNSNHVIKKMNKKWTEQINKIQKEFAKQLQDERKRCSEDVKKSQGKMAKAEEEWNRIEYDLRGEREEHLRTCLQLKECRIQLNELDKESTQRISELTADITELKEQLQTAVDGATHQAELANALKESTSSVKDIRLGYRQKAQDLEKVYGEKINWLINRVEQLENSRSRPESNASSSVSSSRSNSRNSRNNSRNSKHGYSNSRTNRRVPLGSRTNQRNNQRSNQRSRSVPPAPQMRNRLAQQRNNRRAGGAGAGAARLLRNKRMDEAQKRREAKFALKTRQKMYGKMNASFSGMTKKPRNSRSKTRTNSRVSRSKSMPRARRAGANTRHRFR